MEQFLGTFRLEKSESFDEYLAAKGVPWLIRKMILASSMTMVFEKADSDSTYILTNKSARNTLVWKFRLGESFEGKAFDGKTYKITFDVKDGQLSETRVPLEGAQQERGETFLYERQGDYLVLNLRHEQLQSKRFFKKQP